MSTLQYAFNIITDAYIFIVLVTVISSWLIAFNIINTRNQIVDAILSFCHAVTEPILRPIRNALPRLGAIDISPLVLYFGVLIVKHFVNNQIF